MKSHETQSFSNGVYKVLVADIAISFDNVIGVLWQKISTREESRWTEKCHDPNKVVNNIISNLPLSEAALINMEQ